MSRLHPMKLPFFAAAAALILPSLSWGAPAASAASPACPRPCCAPSASDGGKQAVGFKAGPGKPVLEQAKESCITGDLGINIVSQYVSRGVVFENQGAILQPYADLYFKLYENESASFLNKVQLNLGIWNSFHEEKTDAGLADNNGVAGRGGSTTDSWYEFDFTAGVSFTFAQKWIFTPSYFTFLSPNDGFATFHGLNLKLAYDDSALWGESGFKLSPYVQVLFELENKAGTGADEGIYYEVGIAPSFPVGPLSVTLPVTAGFGSHDFYGSLDERSGRVDDEWFGFVSGGVNLAYALPDSVIPECLGAWTVSAGYTYYYLGEGTRDFNTPARGGAVRSAEEGEHEHVFSAGIVVAF